MSGEAVRWTLYGVSSDDDGRRELATAGSRDEIVEKARALEVERSDLVLFTAVGYDEEGQAVRWWSRTRCG